MPTTRRPAARLRCEALEARDVPAVFTPATADELIRDVAAANASPGPDTIVLNAGATYTLTAASNATHGPTGLPVIESEGGPLTIAGRGAVVERSPTAGTPQAPAYFRLLAVEVGASLTAENLTLQGGVAVRYQTAAGWYDEPRGGAVYNAGALTLRGVTVKDNTARGFEAYRQNGGAAFGGGVYSDGALTVADSTIRNNLAVGGRGSVGGGGHFDSPAGRPGGPGLGGGVYVAGGTADLTGVTLTDNTARGGSGGSGPAAGTGRERPNGGAGGNGQGGGLHAAGEATTLTGCTVQRNEAVGGDGGNAGRRGQAGANGVGQGGGVYVGPAGDADWDAATRIVRNAASSAGKNMYRT